MKASSNLVRWILVVTLGCSLGLLLICIVASLHPGPLAVRNDIYVANRHPARESGFTLTQEDLEKELAEVIEGQLAAFRQNDYPKAYEFAASGLKADLPLPAFERMVRHGYPMIAQSRSAQFGVMLDNGSQALVNVVIVGDSGHIRHYQYLLQLENGGWKIYGVTEVKPSGMTV